MNKLEQHLEGYIKAQVELTKIELKVDLAKVTARFSLGLMVIFFMALTLLMSTLALGFYLNEVFESSFMGFLFLALVYSLLSVIFFLLSKNKKLEMNLSKTILNTFHE